MENKENEGTKAYKEWKSAALARSVPRGRAGALDQPGDAVGVVAPPTHFGQQVARVAVFGPAADQLGQHFGGVGEKTAPGVLLRHPPLDGLALRRMALAGLDVVVPGRQQV